MTIQIAGRLKEERHRVEAHQGKFAARLGISQRKQSFLENGDREIRADYLAAVARLGIDVQYVLTGERSVGDRIDAGAAELLDDYSALPARMQAIARRVLKALDESQPELIALQENRISYRADIDETGNEEG